MVHKQIMVFALVLRRVHGEVQHDCCTDRCIERTPRGWTAPRAVVTAAWLNVRGRT